MKHYQLVSTGITSNSIPTDISTGIKRIYDNDILYEDLNDLTNDQFKCWYMKAFYKLGKDKVLVLASQARADGSNPKKLFSHLLKKNMIRA